MTKQVFKQALVSILVFVQVRSASADIAIRAPGLDRSIYRGALAAHLLEPFSLSASDAHLAALKSQLNRQLEIAQNTFLEGSQADARDAFANITKMSHEASWPLTQRKVIHYSFLRQAQLSESDSMASRQALRAAAAFDSHIDPDPRLFSPPFIARFRKERQAVHNQSVLVPIRERFEGFELLLLNGRTYRIRETSSLRVAPGEHRVELRSDIFAPVSEVLSTAHLQIFSPSRNAMAAGSCESPSLAIHLPTPVSLVYDADCVQRLNAGIWQRLGTPATTSVATLTKPTSALLGQPVIPPGLELPEPPKVRPFYKKGWFWAVIGGAVIASFALRENQRGKGQETSSVTPSQREGF